MNQIRPGEWWEKHGYLAGKPIQDGLWICLAPMIFTIRLMICDEGSVYDFYCYPQSNLGLAFAAFDEWDGKGKPIDGWLREHHR